MLKQANIVEPLCFVLVGATATVCHFAIYLSAISVTTHLKANFLAYILSVGVSYLGNRLITFRAYRLILINYIAVSLASLFMSSSIAFLLGDMLGLSGVTVFICIAVSGLALSYILQKKFSVKTIQQR